MLVTASLGLRLKFTQLNLPSLTRDAAPSFPLQVGLPDTNDGSMKIIYMTHLCRYL